ncbi:MAG: TRAM domain-containing protein [Spirochaetaceae bacterium]|jgi:23S rRNA (uracil1939-C5)-methyltransferase|nr:TRAM domain-containing protein [Spirochaetaceae bacterium]
MVTGDSFSAEVESIASDGSGVARAGGMAVFLEMTAPGDIVSARITELHRSWARARVETLESPSPLRAEPACPAYGSCGGCSLQHLSYEAQLAAKKAILRDAFTRIGGFREPPEITALPSPAWGCRNRVRLHRGAGGLPGFKGRRSGEVWPLRDCPVADPGIRRLLAETGEALPEDGVTLYSRGELLLAEGRWRELPPRGRLRLLDRDISLDAGLFFQSNAPMQEALIRGVLAAAEGAAPGGAADLYSGVGVFAAFLRDRFERLFLAEQNPAALALARENAGEAEFFAGPSEKAAPAWLRRGGLSFIVADPPRGGLARSLAESLAAAGPEVLAYVSCNAASLARDARILCGGAYALKSLTLYDFYPQTAHIESLAVFIR